VKALRRYEPTHDCYTGNVTRVPNDKVIIVTGGSSGIGKAAAVSFARQGAKVIISGRRRKPLETTVAKYPDIAGLVANVATPDDAARTVGKPIEMWGSLMC
jgi:NAD(P)-dependent dehydrogenase (short-subunit alcohol dehydrogenase family)